jgi:RNA polymerase sigma-70 factor (ECF subfamily)
MTSRSSSRKAGSGYRIGPKGNGIGSANEMGSDKGRAGESGADLELVRRFKDGDPEAFDAIFETYSAPLLGFLTRMCGDPEDAREGLQDTFLSVFRYLEGFRGEASLKNWIFKIAVTACLKKKRKMQPVPSDDIEGVLGGQAPSDAFRESRPWNTDPEELLLDGEFRQLVVQGVASMPYIYKVVINLRDFEGFSTQEVSRILGIKESTVKVRLHRARLLLQDWLRQRFQVPTKGKAPEKG